MTTSDDLAHPETDTPSDANGSDAGPSLRSLRLTNFRNYSQLSLTLDAAPVVLTGANGAGKTNLLEAVSLLAPGRGMRRAKISDLDRVDAGVPNPLAQPWAVLADLQAADDVVQLATGRDAEAASQGGERRLVRIDGQAASQQALAQHLNVVWLVPSMDRLFQEGATERRKFFDRLVYGFELDHARYVSAYEQTMRERNQLLSDRIYDDGWFSTLEAKMAEHAVVIAAYRLQVAERLNAVIASSPHDFPKAHITVDGMVENALAEGRAAVEVEGYFRDHLAAIRDQDRYAGRTGEGVHRSEWQVFHLGKGMEARQCSTGEQKAVLLSIILAVARARKLWGGGAPILLLDEVVAHLDIRRRGELAEEILDIGGQAWLTGTDAEPFGELARKAQFFTVSDAIVELQNNA